MHECEQKFHHLPYHACICAYITLAVVSLGKQTRLSMLWHIHSTYSIDDHATVFLERGMHSIHTSAPDRWGDDKVRKWF